MAIQILSPAHEAVFDEQNGLLIKALDDEHASVALTREEVAVLRVLIAPPVTDKQLNKLLIGLDAVAREYDRNTWGIPLVDKKTSARYAQGYPRLACYAQPATSN